MSQGTLTTDKGLATLLKTTVTQLQGTAPTSDGLGELIASINKAIYGFAPAGSRPSQYLGPTGCIAESMDRASTTFAYVAVSSGTLYLSALYLPANTVVSNLNTVTGSTASSGVTHNWMCLADNALSLLAVSADNTTNDLSASTLQTYAIATVAAGAATSFTTTYSGLYYVGFMIATGTTQPTIQGQTDLASTMMGLAPKLCGSSNTGATTPPAFPATLTSITSSASQIYTFVS